MAGTFFLAGGCVGPVPRSHVTDQASRAAGMPNAIHFETSGGPIDASPDSADSLTLAAATRLALTTDPEVHAALARVRAAEADAEQARLLPNPILTVGVAPRFSSESAVITLAVSEDLVEFLERPLKSSAADWRLRVAVADCVATVLDAIAEVQERYADVQAGDAQQAVLEGRRALLDRLLEVARARLKAGETARLDVTTIESRRQLLEADIGEKKIELHDARLALARLIGRPGGWIDWRVAPWAGPPGIRPALQDWLTAAHQHRPEIESHRWELAALGDDARLAPFVPWEGASLGGNGERDVTWYAGPDVSTPVPIFDDGRAKRKKAVAAVIQARHKLVGAERKVVEDVRRAFDTFNATRALLAESRSKLLPLQELRRQQAEGAYRAGESDLTTLLIAEEDLQDTRAKLVDLEQKTQVALIHLERAVGGPGVAAALETRPATNPTTTPQTQADENRDPSSNTTKSDGGNRP